MSAYDEGNVPVGLTSHQKFSNFLFCRVGRGHRSRANAAQGDIFSQIVFMVSASVI